MWCFVAVSAAAALFSLVDAGNLAPIIVRGNRMYNSQTNERFFIKGITYDYDVSDENYPKSKPIIMSNLKDIINDKGKTFNTFRLYNANPSKTYDQFMTDMDALGIYVMISASPANDPYFGDYRYSTITKAWGPDGTQVGALAQKDQTKTCYPALLLEYGKMLIKDFAKYDNTLGIVVANEIMQENLMAAACVKQYTTDMKNWMRFNANSLRILPLAYAAADSAATGGKTAVPNDYHVIKIMGLLCGDTMVNGVMQSSIDIYMINEYRWCNVPGTFGPYQEFVDLAKGVPIVMALGEFGCEAQTPRTWTMIPYLYSDSATSQGFTDVFSGGFAYAFGEGSLPAGSKFPLFTGGSKELTGLPGTKPTADYTNLATKFKAVTTATELGAFTKATICTWAPPTPPLGTKNKIVAATGTWMPVCTDPNIVLLPTDKWTTNTRQNAVCNKLGAPCEVTIESANPTTEVSICGKPIVVPSGGGTCKTNADCGSHGQCQPGADGSTLSCQCIGCWSGVTCSMFSQEKCNTLKSNPNAPKVVFTAVGVFLGVMLLVFGGLGIAAGTKAGELRKAEQAAKRDMNAT
ncbi:Aste57867_15636 [Aphanomyces stellatus]|uniref:Aste57867_15636 protein n=1 Tax=Aphanomyces stellatus TaxID=120398 RepID=A0A485L3V8_9STRA|nr:hypothetical protein As57867_015580 [Aphanomyces stellatus]VFT92433.1 Aste57867_15636 [Aphanomyces stellatus]